VALRGWLHVSGLACLGWASPVILALFPRGSPCCYSGSWRLAEASELPRDLLASLPGRADVVQPTSPLSRLPRVGVVLAAGRSERLESVTGGGSKALSGWVASAWSSGPCGPSRPRAGAGLGRGRPPWARPGPGRARRPVADGNDAALAAVQGEVQGEALFALVTADHLFGEGALRRLLAAGEPAVLVDAAPDRAAWLEGTRVRVVDEAAVGFGKHLEEPAIDCGAFLLPPEVFDCQRQAAAEGDHSLAGGVTRLAQARPLRAVALRRGVLVAGRGHPRRRAGGEGGVAPLAGRGRRRAGQPLAQPAGVGPAVDGAGPAAARARPGVTGRVRARPGRGGVAGGRPGPGGGPAGSCQLGRRRR
jgi:hypothetical protein